MWKLPLLLLAATPDAASSYPPFTTIFLDFSNPGASFEGIGALSGGGGVTRLLIDYPAPLQADIFDILFKPNAGAALQIIKVEIGGDTQSTEGTELSHAHVRGDLNCSRGYEWLVLTEAKKRNPAIRTYGLAWGVPGWIGDQEDPSGSFYTQDNIDYHLSWLDCALNTHGVEIDYMGCVFRAPPRQTTSARPKLSPHNTHTRTLHHAGCGMRGARTPRGPSRCAPRWTPRATSTRALCLRTRGGSPW